MYSLCFAERPNNFAPVKRHAFELVGQGKRARSYTAENHIALLLTYSGHIAMDPDKQEFLFREIRRRIDARPEGVIRKHDLIVLNVARPI